MMLKQSNNQGVYQGILTGIKRETPKRKSLGGVYNETWRT